VEGVEEAGREVIELEGGCRVTTIAEDEPLAGDKVSLRVVRGAASLHNESEDEVLYELGRDRGIYLPAGETLDLHSGSTYVSVRCPASGGRTTEIVTLDERPLQRTGDRWYRELITAEVTQFVGIIPPGRAPDHFHLYEEVICILDGAGFLWAGASKTPIAAGSCIYLPIRQRHCVENSGPGDLRLMGVFYPAGSPAVRYPS
jgi:mannose-6-phosphate isomerase-like protein (cupin superfamily)